MGHGIMGINNPFGAIDMRNTTLSKDDEAAGRFVQDEAGNRYPLDPNTVYFQDKKSKVWYPDFIATLDRQRALEQAAKRQQQKRWGVGQAVVPPLKDPVYTKGFLEHIRVIFGVWLPGWHHSMSFCIVPIHCVPELRQQIVDRDCYLHNGEPCLILGEPRILNYGSSLADYVPGPVYLLADSLKWTKRLRDLQVEKEHKAAGPGKRYLELEAQLKALEEKVNA
jgi:hypothetical protein